jgi:hypothetical protein
MREELRKPVYGGLYFGSKVACLLFCGFLWFLSYFMGVITWSVWKDSSTGDFFTFFLSILLLWLVILLIFSLLSFPLLWHFKRVDSSQTKKIACIVGFLVWHYVNNASFSLTEGWHAKELSNSGFLPFSLILIPILVGWGTSRVVDHVLSLVGQRLQACDPKPGDPSGGGEVLQKEGGMQDA